MTRYNTSPRNRALHGRGVCCERITETIPRRMAVQDRYLLIILAVFFPSRPGQTRARSLSLWALLDDNMSVVDWIVRVSFDDDDRGNLS